ncbi:hypothetical protein K438DRAFT_1762438 [Mycena galopus ATCC 62051]|nr:hypothetical protein K438DRAFT_1762438 [Mycena galopus ATCC 62051]
MSTAAGAGRKPADFNLNHFTRLETKGGKTNRHYYNPNTLGDHIEGRDNNLLNHISDSRKCPNAPTTARGEALRLLASKKPLVHSEQSDSAVAMDVDTVTAPSLSSSSQKKRKLQGTLDGYVDQPMTVAQKNNADRKFLRFLIHANVSFRSAESCRAFMGVESREMFGDVWARITTPARSRWR